MAQKKISVYSKKHKSKSLSLMYRLIDEDTDIKKDRPMFFRVDKLHQHHPEPLGDPLEGKTQHCHSILVWCVAHIERITNQGYFRFKGGTTSDSKSATTSCSGSKWAIATSSNSQWATILGDQKEYASSYEATSSKAAPAPQIDYPTPIVDKPNKCCMEGKQ